MWQPSSSAPPQVLKTPKGEKEDHSEWIMELLYKDFLNIQASRAIHHIFEKVPTILEQELQSKAML